MTSPLILYCDHADCFAIIGVKLYDRLPSDSVEDSDGRKLGDGEKVFVAIEPIALCEEHRGERLATARQHYGHHHT